MANIAPPAVLAHVIQGYMDYSETTRGFRTRRELPHAKGVFILNLGGPLSVTDGAGADLNLSAGEAFVAGVHLQPALVRSPGFQSGTHVFLPLTTLRRLLGIPMDELVNQVVGLDALLGSEARILGEQLLEAGSRHERAGLLDSALTKRLAGARPLAREQDYGLQLLRARPDLDIRDIAHDIGWSRKHFAARIKDAIGVGPRCYRRLLRFQSLIESIERDSNGSNWAGLAQDAGYFDQAHMINEFREFSGMTPRAYLARWLPEGGGLVEG